jgi:thiol:disulfide interchange protein DsbD
MEASTRIMRLSLPIILLLALVLPASRAGADTEHVRLEVKVDREAARGGQLDLEVLAHIAPGWHINAHEPIQSYLIPTELRFDLPPGVAVDAIFYPPAERRAMRFAGGDELLVYTGKLGIATALLVPADFPRPALRIGATLRYQACNDARCLPPSTARTEQVVPIGAVAAERQPAPSAPAATPSASDGRFARWLEERGWALTLLAVAVLGLGLNLTPCVYPLISVTLAFFGRQARTRQRVFGLALLYVLGIAITFSALGVIAALSGSLFGAALQQPAVVVALAGLFAVLALSCFGVFQLQLPAAVTQRAGSAAGGALGALFMGLTMGVVAAPCVGPVVIGLLVFVGSRQDVGEGFLLFFTLALGLGSPYVLLALAAGSINRLPRSGEWLQWTERLFGCVLLALAAHFVAPLLPGLVRPYAVSAVVAVAALYLGFVERSGDSLRHFSLVKRGVAVAGLGAALWLGQVPHTAEAIAWRTIADLPVNGSGTNHRPLLIDFAAEWCIPCREMDHTTYAHREVIEEARRFHMVKADITQENEVTTRIVERYAVRGVPTLILFSSQGDERERLVGYVGPDELLGAMRKVR